MPDWSKIGRRSRRKGKRFECEVAAVLREWSGWRWDTTRNSGRTDLKGDVYAVLHGDRSPLIECKNRKISLKSFLTSPPAWLEAERVRVMETAEALGLPLAMFFIKVEGLMFFSVVYVLPVRTNDWWWIRNAQLDNPRGVRNGSEWHLIRG
jgi:hypothetical protein